MLNEEFDWAVMVEHKYWLLDYYKEQSVVMIDQYKMDNNVMDMKNKNHEEDMMVDNNMNPYFLEMNNE